VSVTLSPRCPPSPPPRNCRVSCCATPKRPRGHGTQAAANSYLVIIHDLAAHSIHVSQARLQTHLCAAANSRRGVGSSRSRSHSWREPASWALSSSAAALAQADHDPRPNSRARDAASHEFIGPGSVLRPSLPRTDASIKFYCKGRRLRFIFGRLRRVQTRRAAGVRGPTRTSFESRAADARGSRHGC
jgi:hypothetical protein